MIKEEIRKHRLIEAKKLLKLLKIDSNKEELIYIDKRINYDDDKTLIEITTKVK